MIPLLDQLHSRCLEMASLVQTAVETTADAVRNVDVNKAQQVFDNEDRIDQEEVQIERAAINLLTLYTPAASDFRAVFSVVKINGDLERIADCAVNVAHQVQVLAATGLSLHPDVRAIADATLKQVQLTVRCLASRDCELANQITKGDDVIDALYNQILQDVQMGMQAHAQTVPGDLAQIMMAKNFERIGDHCNNIAEDVVFLRRGQIIRHIHDPVRLQG